MPGGESPLSEATRSATLMAAILRGCVQMMLHCAPWPASVAASSKYCGTCTNPPAEFATTTLPCLESTDLDAQQDESKKHLRFRAVASTWACTIERHVAASSCHYNNSTCATRSLARCVQLQTMTFRHVYLGQAYTAFTQVSELPYPVTTRCCQVLEQALQ